MTRRGLTLVELLLVMAIVSSLIAISLPALVCVRNQAQAAVCVQNLKALSLAWLLYKDDNDDRLVGGIAGNEPGDWVRIATGNSAGTTAGEREGIRTGALFRYTDEAIDIYRCPADQRALASGQTAFRSYSIAGGANGERYEDSYVPAQRYAEILMPAMKYIFVEEADPTGKNAGSWVLNPKTKAWVDPLAIWHSWSRSSLGYADGHAETHGWVDNSTIEMSKQQEFHYPVPADEGHDLRFMLSGFPQRLHDTSTSGVGAVSLSP
ncbi:MAG: prepilin-type N-terminal cleavage/methylation domain-containing protein [Sedimentisphaerales bacterium]|nr:prepilin-type N-terminal cleavage/methylation domain-containing protein [Sedimentisphaerales bacterium]